MAREQKRLFDEPAPWEEDEHELRPVASVVFPTGPSETFDYFVPNHLCTKVSLGCRVRAPLGRGNRSVTGYCVALEHRKPMVRALKSLVGVVDERSLLSRSMIELTRWIASRYLCSWGAVLETVVPAAVRGQAGTRLTTLLSASPEVAARRAELKLPDKQARLLDYLLARGEPILPVELAAAMHCTQAPIKALYRKGLIHSAQSRLPRSGAPVPTIDRQPNLTLDVDQERALGAIREALHAGRHECILLYGVTGSGKTEVYIQAIQEVVRFGRQAIVLVPEISLTPQTIERFRARFDEVAVLHSHQRDAERHWHWQRIASGHVPVVVGARSAIFAPTPQLGLIVMDEEHESSFKQEAVPRYHARRVAIERARMEGVPLVLGSATPSLESWHETLRACRLARLPRRVSGRSMPRVEIIDLREEIHARTARGAISRPLAAAMQAALADDGQIILLLNRRGFATQIQCPSCGQVVRCPSCDIALTHHRHLEIALCHYCDYQMPPPEKCHACGFAGIRYGGLGTQRLEAEVLARFPAHMALRMDTDAMQGAGAHEKALSAFRAGEARILLGTQMIAKGLDFPNVTLVGVVNADTALHLPDFRAAERTFQLLAQVAGRTGRGERPGRVLVQTFNPDHPAIRCAAAHDFDRFAQQELPHREALSYPPYASLIRLVIRGTPNERPAAFAQSLRERLEEALAASGLAARILGPAPAPITRLRGQFRYQVQIQGSDEAGLSAAIRQVQSETKPPDGVQWIADVDPMGMM